MTLVQSTSNAIARNALRVVAPLSFVGGAAVGVAAALPVMGLLETGIQTAGIDALGAAYGSAGIAAALGGAAVVASNRTLTPGVGQWVGRGAGVGAAAASVAMLGLVALIAGTY